MLIKNKEHYVNVFEYFKQFNNAHTLWKQKYSNTSFTGSRVDLAVELQPTSPQDFFDKYTNNGEYRLSLLNQGNYNNKKIMHMGRTLNELIELSKMFKKDLNEKIDDELCLDYVINSVIINTYYGYKGEETIRNFLQEKIPDKEVIVSRAPKKLDFEIGADLIIEKNGTVLGVVQCKSNTFFKWTKDLSLIKDRETSFQYDEKMKCIYPNAKKYFLGYNYQKLMKNEILEIDFNINGHKCNNNYGLYTLDKLISKDTFQPI
jgi:hypothetical protein